MRQQLLPPLRWAAAGAKAALCLRGLRFLLSGVLHRDHSKGLLHGWPGLTAFTPVGEFFSLIKYYCCGITRDES